MSLRRHLLALALFVPFGSLVTVAIRTARAERGYARVAEQVRRDYAAIAAWQFARRARMIIHDQAMDALAHDSSAHGGLPSDSVLSRLRRNAPALAPHVRYAFSIDLPRRRIDLTSAAPVWARESLERRLSALAAVRHGADPHQAVVQSGPNGPEIFATSILRAPDSTAAAAIGYVASPAALDSSLTELLSDPRLLTGLPHLTRLMPGDLDVRVLTSENAVVYSAGGTPGTTMATDSVELRDAGLRAVVDLSPRLAQTIVSSSAPGSQLPAQLMMIVISAALGAAGFMQLRRAQALSDARSRFVANVSHELRTPLAQISMFAETLSLGRERSETEGRQFASIIHGEARRLALLAESVLRFSRREQGADSLQVERVELRTELEQTVDAFAPIAAAADATVTLENVDQAAVLMDRGALRQVMLNLLDNAVKHGGRGVRVEVRASAAGTGVRIAVDDSGPGVPPEWREKVFGAYVKVDRGNNSGAGIGLSIVKDLVAASGGKVWIEPSELGGARFVVVL